MSQLIIRRNNRARYIDDDDDEDDDDDDDYSMSNNVKYLTPRKYRTPQRIQLPNVFPKTNINDEIELNKNEYVLTPSKYRLKKTYPSSFNYNNEKFNQQSHEDQDNTKLLYNKYPIIIGDFLLKEKPNEDNSIYNYKPKNTETSYVYQGIVNGSKVQERALNEMKQLVQQPNHTSSSSHNYKKPSYSNIPPTSIDNDYRNQLSIRDNKYPSMMNLSSNIHRSATDDDLIINNPRNSIHNSLRRQSRSFSSFYPLPSSVYENQHTKFPSNSYNTQIAQNNIYYFGKQSENISSNDEEDSSSEDEECMTFGHNSQPKLARSLPTIYHATFVPYINNNQDNNYDDIIFQEVIDVGTSTDNTLLDTPMDNRLSYHQKPSLTKQQSILTTQSFRSETETYRVNEQTINQENHEKPDTVPFQPSISTSNQSTTRPYSSLKEPDNSEENTIDTGQSTTQSSKSKTIEEESHQSISEPPQRIQRLHRKNPLAGLPPSEYATISIDQESEPHLSVKSIKTNKSHSSFLNLFRRNKKTDKSKKKKEEKKKRKT